MSSCVIHEGNTLELYSLTAALAPWSQDAMSSSESRGRDVIDLDRYMRGVRPSPHCDQRTRERLIVDAGGVDRLPVEVTSSSSGPLPRAPLPSARDHGKRYSHDSGVSDGSYLRQRHRPYRRSSENKHRDSSRTAGSNSSVREFKAACQKALREQQEQIARVTELCEKLVQPHLEQNLTKNTLNNNVGENIYPENLPQHFNSINQTTNQISQCYSPDLNQNLNNTKQNFGQNVSQVNRVQRPPTPGTSDTSSTFSSRGIRIKERHRSDSCKTYQLIMGKLDELSHLFASRRVPATAGRGRDSSGSVLVCDKVVATEDGKIITPIVQIMHSSRMNDCEYSMYSKRKADFDQMGETLYTVNGDQWNKANNLGSAGDIYDLDNPLNLYAQAKRLQTLHASNQREAVRSEDIRADNTENKSLDSSMCALCRGYWRAVRRYFTQQFFGTCT